MIEHLLARLLRGKHAGETHLAWNHPAAVGTPAGITLTSPSFAPGGTILLRFAGKGVGENISPALTWSGLPQETAALALVVEDPDAPLRRPFVHLIATGLDPSSRGLEEGALSGAVMPPGAALGRNTFRRRAYAGPRPPLGHGPHRCVFQLFAIAKRLAFDRPLSRDALMAELAGAAVGKGRLDGIVERR